MSMIGHFLLVSDVEHRRAKSSPEFVERLIDAAYESPSPESVDVDKAWHCLHFLLTGTAWEGKAPLDFIVRGGIELGADTGYGPPRVFGRRELEAIADALDPLDRGVLLTRFDPRRMEQLEIYPQGWSTVDLRAAEHSEYFLGAFEALKDLIRRGRSAGQGLMVWLA